MTAIEFQQLAAIRFTSGIMPIEKIHDGRYIWTDLYAVKYSKHQEEYVIIFNLVKGSLTGNNDEYLSRSRMPLDLCIKDYKQDINRDFLSFKNSKFEKFLGWYWDKYMRRYL